MTKLFAYLKPYWFTITLCVLLLFGQAICELNLPNYMSNIVNIGIQQSGIENAAPEAISENGYNMVTLFMSDDEKKIYDENYLLVKSSEGSEKFDSYIQKYPLLKTENIYVMKEQHQTSIDILNDYYSRACMTFINVMKELPSRGTQNAFNADNLSSDSFKSIYSIAPMLTSLPKDTLDKAKNSANNMDKSLLEQSSMVITKQFYNELGINTADMQNRYIITTGFYMLAITLLAAIATILVTLFASRIAAGVAKHLRSDVFSKVESFSNEEFDKLSTASLITRTTNDITQVQVLIVMALRMLIYAPIIGAGGIIMAVNNSVSMSWIIALGVIILLSLVGSIFVIAMPKFKTVQKLVDRLNLVTRENLSGILVIRAFGTQKFEEKRFDKANGDLTRVNLFVNRVMAFMMPAMMFIMNGITLLIVWVGAHQISQSAMQVGDMMAFMQYSMQIIMAFLMISMIFILVPRAAVSIDRIFEALEVEPAIKDLDNAKVIDKPLSGKVEFKNVSFCYHNADDPVLKDINFTALPGMTTAIIGSTGSGKSTLINLIPRFYDATDGEILIDGINIKDMTQVQLRENIGYIPQKGMLFSGTIASNLRYGKKDATDEELLESAEIAQATEFIKNKDKGINSEISQGGSNVSGGQKQRLAIARALVKKAPIYIFDDSFSALDFKTDATLRKSLKKYISNSTILIVAQRISTILNAEQIIVLDEGEIVGKGTHKELLENCETYREIAKSQLSEEELR